MNSAESKTAFVPESALSAEVLVLMRTLSAAARRKGIILYLVGGVVRDVLLGRPATDIDLLVEGDTIKFLRDLKNEWEMLFPHVPSPTKLSLFTHYETGKLHFPCEIAPEIQVLEFAGARAESYPVPGGKPNITKSDLRHDLSRRDFSINAMALGLDRPGVLPLYDFHSGVVDIEAKELRILHPQSFRDDPARLLRAVRLSTRFAFSFEQQTALLFAGAVKENYLSTLPKPRLFTEFCKLLSDEQPALSLEFLAANKMLEQIHPMMSYDQEIGFTLETSKALGERFKRLFPNIDDQTYSHVLDAFGLRGREKDMFIE